MEYFPHFHQIFKLLIGEMDALQPDGALIEGSNVRVVVAHAHDFKVLYLLQGSKGPNSTQH